MKKKLLIILSLASICFSNSAWATNIVSVARDAFTDSRYPTTTSPSSMYLWSGEQVNNNVHAYTFLQFDLNGGALSSNSELSMYCNYVYGTYQTTTKVWYLPNDSWDDDTITYSNMPDFWYSPALLDEQYIASIGWYSFDVGSVTDNDGILSFAIGSLLPSETAEGNYWRDFENLEHTGVNNAYITNSITNGEPIPEPATMLLLGSGLVGLAGFKRKKNLKK